MTKAIRKSQSLQVLTFILVFTFLHTSIVLALELVRQKNVATHIVFPVIDADGDPVTAAASLDSEYTYFLDNTAGVNWADCASEATELEPASGWYDLALSQAEMNHDYIAVQIKTSTSGAKTEGILIRTLVGDPLNIATSDDGGTINVTAGAIDTVSTATATTTVNGLAANVITATAINADAITAAKIAADAIGATEIANASIDAATFAAGAIDAAAIATDAIGAAEIAAAAITVSEAPTLDAAMTTRAAAATALTNATWTDAKAGYLTGDAFVRLGAPAGANVSADVAAVKTDTAAVKIKTDYLPSATAGAAGGVFIAGSNAATSITTALTANITGNLSGSVGSVTGAVGSVTGAVGSVTGAVGSVTGAVGSVAGAVGSVTGNVGGNVTGSVGSIASGGITATSIAADAIGASELAADAVDEIWDEVQSGHATAGTFGKYLDAQVSTVGGGSAASIADAVWDEATSGHTTGGTTGAAIIAAGSAGDPWSTTIPGAYGAGTAGYIVGNNVNAPIATVDTIVDAIKVKTDSLTFTGAGIVDSNVMNWKGSAATAMTGDSYARLGAPAGASVSADVAAIKSDSASILVDTAAMDTSTELRTLLTGSDTAVSTLTTGSTIAGVTTVATCTNMTNAPTIGDLTATMKASVTTAASSATPVLSAAGVDAIWDEVASGHTTSSTFGKYLDKQITTIDDNPWDNAARTLTAGTNISLAKGTGITGFNDIVAADVWGYGSGRTITGGTVTTNSDKTGYSLTQTFPTNFSSLAITAGGAVTAATVSDKTGYALSGTQTFNNTGTWTGNIVGSLSGAIGGLSASALADFFDTNSGTTYGSAVAGSVVKEISDNSGVGTSVY